MEVVAFKIEEKTSKNGKKYRVFYAVTKDGSNYFISFVNKLK